MVVLFSVFSFVRVNQEKIEHVLSLGVKYGHGGGGCRSTPLQTCLMSKNVSSLILELINEAPTKFCLCASER